MIARPCSFVIIDTGVFYWFQVLQVALFDMQNSNRFNILSISIFSKISLSIPIFSKISLSISYFPKSPYQIVRFPIFLWCFSQIPLSLGAFFYIFRSPFRTQKNSCPKILNFGSPFYVAKVHFCLTLSPLFRILGSPF